IDRTGKLVIPLKLDNANDFYEGRATNFYATSSYEAATGPYEAEICAREGKWGYIDKQGNTVIPPKFDEVRDFSEGRAAVKIGEKWGYINLEGEMVVPPRFQPYYTGNPNTGQPSKFSEGLASVAMPQTQKSGYIDKNGKFSIDPIFDEASDFKDGLAIVRINEKAGVIDKTRKYVIEPKFDDIDIFSEGLAAAVNDKKIGFIDKNGQLIIKPQFDTFSRFNQGRAIVGMKKEMPAQKDCEGNECNNQSQQKSAEPSHHFCSLNLHGFLGRLTD
ncbi:MAG: WG repeat-containing protein, partial [Microcoleus sp. T1-bin1]|nr:WG repeat-containing protein [Microcoleus sp. T1-bin1]MBD0341015.1 WG repeat-containing protein [Microcoleus sp. Co-bin12]